MIFKGRNEEYFQIEKIHSTECYTINEELENPLTFLWFETDGNKINIDGVEHTFNKNQIVCLTEFHVIDITKVCNAKLVRFNRSFYCIMDHDSEVSCKGVLFFGASQLPFFTIHSEDLDKFQTIWKMLKMEMESRDELQLEMLQSMLKRFMILCTRIYKSQHNYNKVLRTNVDVIREFNFLVEQHFKTKHAVQDYASLLNKSSKTISNIFSKLSDKTPLQYIHDRKLLDAKRQLQYSDKSIKEIAYDLGYEDIQAFSRFFKKQVGVSPSAYKSRVLTA